MRIFSKKIILISTLFLLFSAALFMYLFNRDNYLLNKTVRLVSSRLIQFERLSYVRKEEYRFEFHEDNYFILNFNNRKKMWEIFAHHKYPHDIIPSIEDLEIVLSRGRIDHFKIKGKKINLKSYLILNFHRPKTPAKKKGIIFYKDGNRRVLGL
jgi:hypothetical protein